jgi:hypothetical protein
MEIKGDNNMNFKDLNLKTYAGVKNISVLPG